MFAILRIDTVKDDLTLGAYALRQGKSYPEFVNRGFELEPPLGQPSVANRSLVAPLAKRKNVLLITGVGHGKEDRFQGDNECNIFPQSVYKPEEVSNKIIHLLACLVGADFGLGKDFVQHGCCAFIGYRTQFTFQKAWAEVFFRCDMEIDLALANGSHVNDAVNAARKQFDIEVKKPANAPIAQQLQDRSDSLVCFGKNVRIDPQIGLTEY